MYSPISRNSGHESPLTKAFYVEMRIRKRIAKVFNKTEEDFKTLRQYNDYLEEVEDMAYNWVKGVGVKEIQAKVNRYEQEHSEEIAVSQARRAEELRRLLEGVDPKFDVLSQGVSVEMEEQVQLYVPSGMAVPMPVRSQQEIEREKQERAERLRVDGAFYESSKLAGGWDLGFIKQRAYQEFQDSLFI